MQLVAGRNRVGEETMRGRPEKDGRDEPAGGDGFHEDGAGMPAADIDIDDADDGAGQQDADVVGLFDVDPGVGQAVA